MRIIAGEARGRTLLTPSDRATRPPLDRIRESIFSILEGAFEGRVVLDLFAGTGSFGLEAVSRGARRAVFVERSRASLTLLKRNIENTGFLSRCEVLEGNALRIPDPATVAPPGFSLVFMDPPFELFREENATNEVFSRVKELLRSPAMEEDGSVILRHPSTFRDEYPFPVAEKRRYGLSVAARFIRRNLET